MTLHRSFSGIPLGRLEGAGHGAGGGGRSSEDSASNSSRTGGLCVSFVADTAEQPGARASLLDQPHARCSASSPLPAPSLRARGVRQQPPQEGPLSPPQSPGRCALARAPLPREHRVSLFGVSPPRPLSPGRLLAASAFFHNGIQGVQDSLQVPLCFDVRDLLLKGGEEVARCPQAPSGHTRSCQQRGAGSEPAQCCCVLRQTPPCPHVTSQHQGEDDNT